MSHGAPRTSGAAPTDVLVIGAGIVGCATAYYLARRGLSVRVVERGRIGAEQSSRAWGLLRTQGRHPAEVELALRALRTWAGLPAELESDLELELSGILVLAENDADAARLAAGARTARGYGIESRLLDPRKIVTLLPGLGGSWQVGLFTPHDGHVEPAKATAAFAAAARRLGVRIDEGVAVTGVVTSGGAARGVRTEHGELDASAIVCAAGIGSADLLRGAGVALPLQVVRASVCQTSATRSITRIPVWAPQAAFRPRADGTYTLGNGYRAIDAEHDLTPDSFRHLRAFLPTYAANRGIVRLRLGRAFVEGLSRRGDARFQPLGEPRVNQRLVDENARGFARLLPQLGHVGIARSWAGRIDATPDLVPVIGPVAALPGCYVAAGFSGHGLALAPAVGQVLAELIVDGRATTDLAPLRCERYAQGDFSRSGEAL